MFSGIFSDKMFYLLAHPETCQLFFLERRHIQAKLVVFQALTFLVWSLHVAELSPQGTSKTLSRCCSSSN